MNINILRNNGQNSYNKTYLVTAKNLLSALDEIKFYTDSTLTYRCGCRSGVCGSCAIRVNGVEKLACKTKINDGDIVEPLNNCKVIKDLVVDVSHETKLIKNTNSVIHIDEINKEISKKDIENIDIQSNCILCNSCYSSCPIYLVNSNFIGPYALTKAYRYASDKKNNEDIKYILDTVQSNGIWDCTLCSACTIVCPQKIDPKSDIMKLQNLSAQNGYSNPNFLNSSFGFDDDFGGFNPNGF